MIWLGVFLESILLLLALWICIIVFKLFLVKGYKDYPPFVPTLGGARRFEIKMISQVLASSQGLTVVDAGCGTAGMIIKLAEKFPQHKFVGIEWNKWLCRIAKQRCKKLNNIEILCQDLFAFDFSKTDIVVCFLLAPIMEKFGQKLKKDAKSGLTIYSYIFDIPNLEASEQVSVSKIFSFMRVYVYRL